LAHSYLFNTCNEEQQNSLLTCDTAHSIWNSLTSRYQLNTVERSDGQVRFAVYNGTPRTYTCCSHCNIVSVMTKRLPLQGVYYLDANPAT
jgi:hypothetical protein